MRAATKIRRPSRGRGCRRVRRVGLTLVALAGLTLGAPLALRLVPLPPALFDPPPVALELTDRHGLPLREVSTTELVTRTASLAALPLSLVDATLAAEDRRFWEHGGVDWRATARAAWQLVRHRRVLSGGSTITQQLIKLAAPRPRTFATKVLEALQAARLEQVWTKPEILTAYLNRLDYGNLRRGPAAASAFYFGCAPADLSVAQAALLAGLPQAPSRLNPHKHFARAKRRQEWILQRMEGLGWLEAAEVRRARTMPICLRPPRRDFAAPHFVDLLLTVERDRIAAHPGGPLATTLDLALQRHVEQTLRDQLSGLRARQVRHGAAVVLEVASGHVLALAGSGDYFSPDAGQVNGAWAPRSPGSALKPFTYVIALESGATPATVLADVPVEFATPTGVYAPRNYDGRCRGPVRLREALANSLNIPAVRLLHDIGGARVLQERLQACGLTTLGQSPEFYGLGLTIGNAEVRLLELANAYACLARLGEFRAFQLLGASSPAFKKVGRVFEADAAWLLADILSDNGARTLAFDLDSPLRFEFPVACKTGTSTAFRDNWAFGYTPEFVVGVWMGSFDGRPMREVSGVTGAAPVMHEIVRHLRARFGTTWYPPPPSLAQRTVHRLTGRLVPAGRDDAVLERFVGGALPPLAGPADWDAAGRVGLGLEYAAWIRSGDNHLGTKVVLAAEAGSAEALDPVARPSLRLEQPLPASVYVLDPDLPDCGCWLPLRARAAGEVRWTSPTLSIEHRQGQPWARLDEGRHELVAREAATGIEQRTWIRVRRR